MLYSNRQIRSIDNLLRNYSFNWERSKLQINKCTVIVYNSLMLKKYNITISLTNI